jgi:citronellol/citronellal dehydrogenase
MHADPGIAANPLAGATVLISGGTRGIGRAIALRLARDGASIAMLAKTREPHPKLPGTLDSVAREIEAAGGRALPIQGDVRSEDDIRRAVEAAGAEFGRLDIVVNNASAIDLTGSAQLPAKRYDLMQSINARGTFLLSRTAIPLLRESPSARILTLSPPLNLEPRWLGAHVGYTVSKYSMTLVTLGLAAELRPLGIAATCLWPRTAIATAAVENILGGAEMVARSRDPQIMADAALAVLTAPADEVTGRTLIDEDVLRARGVEDFSGYASVPDSELFLDLFVDP